MTSKLILCVDFDGVINSYVTGWRGADVINDPPVPGAIEFLRKATQHFDVHVHSSRSHQPGGVAAMRHYIAAHGGDALAAQITFPDHKPPAFLSIDDRALTFTGIFPAIEQLKSFRPWNKREAAGVPYHGN